MKGVYKIKNTITGEYYIGSSKDLEKRILSHKVLLKNNKHTNHKLQDSYNQYGKDSFVFYELKLTSDDASNDDLIKLEQCYLDSSEKNKLFNLKFTATASRTSAILETCYVLDLYGNIIKGFKSVSECFRWLCVPINIGNLNTYTIYKDKYIVVTKDFFDDNYEIIKSTYNRDNKIETLKKINLKTCRVYCTINEKIIEFEDYRCASYFLGVTQSNIILILKGKNKKNPFNIRTIK